MEHPSSKKFLYYCIIIIIFLVALWMPPMIMYALGFQSVFGLGVLAATGITLLLKGKIRSLILREKNAKNYSFGIGAALLFISLLGGGIRIWAQIVSKNATERILETYKTESKAGDLSESVDSSCFDYEFFLDELYIFKYPNNLREVKIDNAPHMRLKLEGKNEYVTISEWDYGWDDMSVWDEAFTSQMKSFLGNEAVISEIEKPEINGIKFVKIVKSMSVAGEPSKIISYATIHQGNLLLISHIFQEGYGSDSNKIINGLELK